MAPSQAGPSAPLAIRNLVGADHGVGTTKGPLGDSKLFDGKVISQCIYIIRPIQQLPLGLEIR